MFWWFGVFILSVALLGAGWYLSYTAARLDRLHVRVEGLLSSLDAQLLRRAECALELSHADSLDAASAFLVTQTAGHSLEVADAAPIENEVTSIGLPQERCEAEADLSAVLTAVCADWGPADGAEEVLRTRLADACTRVQLAHRFYNDAVADVRRVRRAWFVRLFRLAGRTAMPRPLQFDDGVLTLAGRARGW